MTTNALSPENLARLHETLTAHVDAGDLPELVALVARGDELHVDVPGAAAADEPLPHGIGWDGGTGVTWRSNPRTGLTGILFTQRHVLAPTPTRLVEDFWAEVNAVATP